MPLASFLNNPSMTEIRFKHLCFLITNSPADENIQSFIEVKRIDPMQLNILFI
jgi:hypothetical protein